MVVRSLTWLALVMGGAMFLGCEIKHAAQSPPAAPQAPVAPTPRLTSGETANDLPKEGTIPEVGSTAPPAGVPPAAAPPANTFAQSAPQASTEQLSARLSAGVALAQTLPTGSAMLFSVDYRLTSGRLDSSSQYAWVIERSQGAAQNIVVSLESDGTLYVVSPDWPPGEGPYACYLVEIPPSGRPASDGPINCLARRLREFSRQRLEKSRLRAVSI